MKKLLLSLFFVLQTVFVFAQGVKGKIVDAKSLTPINAVLAGIQGTNISSLTDDKGIFILEEVSTGRQIVIISYSGYITKRFPVDISENQVIDLGTILLEEDYSFQVQEGLISLTENDLNDDNSSTEASSSLLQATKDPLQQAAAFNWGTAFFRSRGLDNVYGKTLINGVVMNKIYDGRPQWGNWGGLNDATRNQEFYSGSTPSDYTFGGILGTQAITTRASYIRKGAKAGFSLSNTNYVWRPYAIYSSGLNQNGWAYAVSASYRGAEEGYWEATNYDALSFFASIEKKFNDQHSINLTAIYAQNKRAKNSPVTDEQVELKGFRYNSYWGWQSGDKRNSRYKEVEEPLFMLTHYWKIDDDNQLTTTAAYQFGHIANSRLGYNAGHNPDPAHYSKLPSSALNKYVTSTGEWTPDEVLAEQRAIAFKQDGQIDWADIYLQNTKNIDKLSQVYLYEDRNQDKTLLFTSNLKSRLTDNISFTTGVNYTYLRSSNFKKMIDLLGGESFLDQDTYQSGDKKYSDLNNPIRFITSGGKFGYNYEIFAHVIDVFTQFQFNYRQFDFYVAQNIGYTSYEREGNYKNPIYPDNSYGKSGKTDFNSFGFKGGITYHLTGRHALDFNAIYYSEAPTVRNTFSNIRINNAVTKDLNNENILSIDGSYIVRTPKLKARITGYLSEIKNSTQINFYYADGVGIVDEKGELLSNSGGAFVSEILTGINKRNLGVELGAEYQLTQTLKTTVAASLGQSFYTNDPTIRLNSDKVAQTFDYGTAYLTNYKTANGPQTAISLGLEYRSPRFWWLTANVNYFDNSYTNISALRRTDNFVKDPELPGQPLPDISEDKMKAMLKQEKLNDFTLVNITGGKSWRLANRNIFGFFASVNNIFGKQYKTGGFEQARNANYKQEILNTNSGVNTFGNKYWYGYGRNFFVNVYYNF